MPAFDYTTLRSQFTILAIINIIQIITDLEGEALRLHERLWNPCILVFVTNACLMVIELVASRLTATRVGVSLHTWTAIIGVILAGVSLGNYIGGRLADRRASPNLLGSVLALASLASLAIIWLNNDLHELTLPKSVPFMVWVLLYVAGVFMLPSILLGCVSPIVVKLSVIDLRFSGRTVGRISAWSSLGSIIGTFATGFLLIGMLGTKNAIVLVAGLLMLLAIWFLTDAPPRRALLQTGIYLALFGSSIGLLAYTGFLCPECLRETNYFCIKVEDVPAEGRTVRQLLLDRLVHSYSDVDDPTYLGYGYEHVYDGLMRPLAAHKPDLSALFIGGGGYTFPRYMEATLPQSHLVVAEIDPGVTEAAHLWLGLSRDTRVVTYNMDARNFLAWYCGEDEYDIVFGDAFNDFSVPYHLTTLEFGRMVDRTLRDDGLYLVNIIDGARHGHFLRAFVHTLNEVFAHVVVIPSSSTWESAARTTFVLAASQRPIDLSNLPERTKPFSDEELNRVLAMKPRMVLTDDYVPVDNLMAPVVEDTFFSITLEPEIMQQINIRVRVVGLGLIGLLLTGLIWLIYHRRARRTSARPPMTTDH